MHSQRLLIAGLAASVVASIALSAGRLTAQSAGNVEIGGFGQFTRTDAAWHVKNGGGAGGRLGVFLTSHLELEAAASFSSFTNEPPRLSGSSSAQTFNGQFTYNIPFGVGGRTHDLLLEAGAGGQRFADHNDFSVPLGGGLRIALTDAVALRFDGIVEYVENPTGLTFDFPTTVAVNPKAARSTNVEIRAGLSLMLGHHKAPPPATGSCRRRAAATAARGAAASSPRAAAGPERYHSGLARRGQPCPRGVVGEGLLRLRSLGAPR